MRYDLILSLLIAGSCCCGQTTPTTTGKAQTEGPCSPAVSGSNNTFTINCGIGKKQGQEMLAILNKILENKLDTNVVLAKLDEILTAVNPNIPKKAYFCNGQYELTGPSANSDLLVAEFGDNRAFKEMADLYNSDHLVELLKACLKHIDSTPGWLTPRLFCGLAYLETGDKLGARKMLADFDAKAGPMNHAEPCGTMADRLHKALD